MTMNNVTTLDYRVVLDVLSSLNHPRALTVAILFREKEFHQIVDLKWDPFAYNTLEDARLSFCATELLRKSNWLPTNIDKQKVAEDGFIAAEEKCRVTNERLLQRNAGVEPILYRALRKIADVLGDFDIDEWLDLSGWGPGVTLTLRGSDATYFRKFHHDGEATPAFARIIPKLLSFLSPHWAPNAKLYEGNRVITVDKNAKTDRVIAIEPSLNLYFQKGVGAMIKRRLKRWGVDLSDQSINQDLARSGSWDNRLATVDFSAASDTISYRLVADLLPFEWYQVLDVLRSPRGLFRNSLIEYEKFSSMGNGFTFELESLIFWAIAKAVVPEDHELYHSISVFGDDMIIPSDYVDLYSEICNHIGFEVNAKKSFSSSYFRESCGGYFWNGVSIKPVRMERSVSSEEEKICFHNRLMEFDRHECFSEVFRGVRSLLINSVDQKLFCPQSLGDAGFWSDKPSRSRYYLRSGRFATRVWVTTPRKEEFDHSGVWLTHLYFLSKGGQSDCLTDYLKVLFGEVEHIAQGNTCAIPRRLVRRRRRLWTERWCQVKYQV